MIFALIALGSVVIGTVVSELTLNEAAAAKRKEARKAFWNAIKDHRQRSKKARIEKSQSRLKRYFIENDHATRHAARICSVSPEEIRQLIVENATIERLNAEEPADASVSEESSM